MSSTHATTISISRDIAAPANVVWQMISDVSRMGEWSPETTACKWLGGADGAAVGAKFKGHNENGRRQWNTACGVTDCEAGRVFAFETKAMGLKVARWEYHFEPNDGGCRVTECWVDQRGHMVKAISPRISGVEDRAAHNEATMRQSLDRLAAEAENSGS